MNQWQALVVRQLFEQLGPIGAVVNSKNVAANMQAECEIDWLTLRDPQLSSVATAGEL